MMPKASFSGGVTFRDSVPDTPATVALIVEEPTLYPKIEAPDILRTVPL
jgi:hypothetical protein